MGKALKRLIQRYRVELIYSPFHPLPRVMGEWPCRGTGVLSGADTVGKLCRERQPSRLCPALAPGPPQAPLVTVAAVPTQVSPLPATRAVMRNTVLSTSPSQSCRHEEFRVRSAMTFPLNSLLFLGAFIKMKSREQGLPH